MRQKSEAPARGACGTGAKAFAASGDAEGLQHSLTLSSVQPSIDPMRWPILAIHWGELEREAA